MAHKENSWKNNKLKKFVSGKVFINHDFTKMAMEIQGHLRSVAMEEKKEREEIDTKDNNR